MIFLDLKADNLMFSIADPPLLETFSKAELEDPSPRKAIDDTRAIYKSRAWECRRTTHGDTSFFAILERLE